ncbi:thioredoxin domain-containing protein 15 isoform X2 [Diachasma alloeum]|uniref:thioredoxin domain-containing protein 15 isoform X2 n=1 Tax=Diachasma alloeum TaxID=454923 RepID=UPI000738216A|nr:thioredoxin domain-containing protein 15 isoform X2 [Diachasma alloeum]
MKSTIFVYLVVFLIPADNSEAPELQIEVNETENDTKIDAEVENETEIMEIPSEANEDFSNVTKDGEDEDKGNATITSKLKNNGAYKIYSNCLTDKIYGNVEVVNATRLMELLIMEPGPSNNTDAKQEGKIPARTCILVLFYTRWCVFSSQAAPHFNALPKFFPHIRAVAIDASKYQNFNTQFGIVGVPTLMFVYNGKPLVRFNDSSYTLESFAKFVTDYTALEPNGSLYVTSGDFAGPVPSTPSNECDYCLILSWLFIAACALYFTLQSQWWKQFVELIQNTWRESNAQHEHTD